MDNKISIIIPAYNIESYITRTLDSVLAQTYEKIDVIVVNDGSTDATSTIIDAYAARDSRVVAIHKENGGVSSARLAGIAASKGDYIGFVDGDDYVEPEMFAHLLKNALEHDADISHCGYQMVFPDGHIDMYYNTGRTEDLSREAGLKAFLKGDYLEPGLWNKLYRREIVMGFADSPLWDSSIRINEDVLMNYILFSRAERSYYEDIPFYHYILRKGSAANSKEKHYQVADPCTVMERIVGDLSEDSPLYPAAFERYLRTLMGAAAQTDWPEDRAQARKCLRRYALTVQRISGVSRKFKLMVFGSVYLSPAYKLVRRIYEKRTGIDHKYDLE